MSYIYEFLLLEFGALLQSYYLVRHQFKKREFFLCIALSLLVFLPTKNELRNLSYSLPMHFLFQMGFFCFIYAFMFRDVLVRRISELLVTHLTILVLFLLLSHGLIPAIPVFIIPVVFVLYTALRQKENGTSIRLLLYIWYLILSLIIVSYILLRGNFLAILDTTYTGDISPITIVIQGMVGLNFAINFLYLFYLIPIPGKRQTFKERLADVREHIRILTSRVSSHQPHYAQVTAITLFQILILIVTFLGWPNYYNTVVNLCLLGFPLLISRMEKQPSPPAIIKGASVVQ